MSLTVWFISVVALLRSANGFSEGSLLVRPLLQPLPATVVPARLQGGQSIVFVGPTHFHSGASTRARRCFYSLVLQGLRVLFCAVVVLRLAGPAVAHAVGPSSQSAAVARPTRDRRYTASRGMRDAKLYRPIATVFSAV